MKADLLQMLADFSTYITNDYQPCVATNSIGENCGCFKGESTMAANEAGVRTNADLSMVAAFLCKYGKGKVRLPEGVTWERLEQMALHTLIFAYSTHKANRLKTCVGGKYWGSTSRNDYVWESSLWAMSVAYSAFFQWDKLSSQQKKYIENLLKAECNYELERSIPTGHVGDTKAEENGWETNVLAVTLGLFPDDPLADKWFQRLRAFAVNCYSHPSDKDNTTIIDPDYDNATIADFYKGQNLYDDYTLQNHNFFHSSYQNVVMQELGESALALKLFQQTLYGKEKWHTNALMHNCQKVMDNVLNWFALADGELAMPNGNDWSLFLYDQITSYSTMACFLADTNALMLENRAYQNILKRQKTTTDGSWLLRPDVQARRMGVQAHRVMMTWLMHEMISTAMLTPTDWEEFLRHHSQAKFFQSQGIVRAATRDRFTCFSWSKGLKSYTGYIAVSSDSCNNIIVPYRSNNTGNFIGNYIIEGRRTNATPVGNAVTELQGNGYVLNGELLTNDSALNHRYAIYSTPGNAVIYLDWVTALDNVTITEEQGGLMAISTDPFTSPSRKIYPQHTTHNQTTNTDSDTDSDTNTDSDSDTDSQTTNWLNIDNHVGFVSHSDKKMAFGNCSNNNSILTSKLYPLYSDSLRTISKGETVDCRHVIYYSNVDTTTTRQMSLQLQTLSSLNKGWGGVIASDPDGQEYMLLSNFCGSTTEQTISNVKCQYGAPVFSVPTTISGNSSSARFTIAENHSVAEPRSVFIQSDAPCEARMLNRESTGKRTLEIKSLSKKPVHCKVTTITQSGSIHNYDYTITGKAVYCEFHKGMFCE